MNRAKLHEEIRKHIRQAYAGGWVSDDLVEDLAAYAVGEEHRALIRRIHHDEFKVFGP